MSRSSLNEVVAASGVKFGTSSARGLVSQMTDYVCYAYAQAFLSAVAFDAPSVVIGHDLRLSSPAMVAACAQAIRDAGNTVIFVGALPTPAVAYYGISKSAVDYRYGQPDNILPQWYHQLVVTPPSRLAAIFNG